MISAKVKLHSVNPNNKSIFSYILKYPRFIHSELMTHRAFTRNAASSRAIPILKMIWDILCEPAMPISWGENCKGMQAQKELSGWRRHACIAVWLLASKFACFFSWLLYKLGAHKQVANRITEPFAHMETMVTATELGNFFNLRCHPAAQPEFRELACQMLEAYVASTPQKLAWGEWHLPFGDECEGIDEQGRIKIATARAARISYKTFDGKIAPERDFALTDKLVGDGHMSPTEHANQAVEHVPEFQRSNIVGYVQYRKTLPNENQSQFDAQQLLRSNGRI